jgi:hypothetical protein
LGWFGAGWGTSKSVKFCLILHECPTAGLVPPTAEGRLGGQSSPRLSGGGVPGDSPDAFQHEYGRFGKFAILTGRYYHEGRGQCAPRSAVLAGIVGGCSDGLNGHIRPINAGFLPHTAGRYFLADGAAQKFARHPSAAAGPGFLYPGPASAARARPITLRAIAIEAGSISGRGQAGSRLQASDGSRACSARSPGAAPPLTMLARRGLHSGRRAVLARGAGRQEFD